MSTDFSHKIRIGTRASKLALTQAYEIKNLLINKCNLHQDQIEIIKITTSGDKIQDVSLADIGGKGLFIKELEENLLAEKIDIAIHSAKDVPPMVHEATRIAAFSARKDARDYFISHKYKNIDSLPQGAVLGTSSARRKAILLRLRPDLQIVNFRGNVDTRLEKLQKNQVDATILATCGLMRLDKKIVAENIIPTATMLPAAGQGCLAIQTLQENQEIYNLLRQINDEKSEICVKIERDFLREIGASCKTPIAAYCKFINDDKITLQTIIFDFNGKEIFATQATSGYSQSHELALNAARKTKDEAAELLQRICG